MARQPLQHKALLEDLRAVGLSLEAICFGTGHSRSAPPKTPTTPGCSSAKPWCSRAPCPTSVAVTPRALIEAAGGKVSGSVSKKTDYLVAGEMQPAASCLELKAWGYRFSTKQSYKIC